MRVAPSVKKFLAVGATQKRLPLGKLISTSVTCGDFFFFELGFFAFFGFFFFLMSRDSNTPRRKRLTPNGVPFPRPPFSARKIPTARFEKAYAELLFWEWPADNRVGNQHVKFSLARYALDGLVVHRTSPQSYKDMDNLFLFAMLAVNRNF